jgi:hypothetical protein
MTDLEKYEKVNSCETLLELASTIEGFADDEGFIQGRSRKFSANLMASVCRRYTPAEHNLLTREFGIRQQAIYILFYNNEI